MSPALPRPAELRAIALDAARAVVGDLAAIIGELKAHRDEHLAQLKLYTGFQADYYPDPDTLTGRKLHQYLVLRGGIRQEEGYIEWCDEVIHGLERELTES